MTELTANVWWRPAAWRRIAETAFERSKTIAHRQARVARYLARRADRSLRHGTQAFSKRIAEFKDRPAQHGALLGLFAMLSALLLALANVGTRSAIADRAQDDLRYSLSQVIPANLHTNNIAEDIGQVHDDKEGTVSVHRGRIGKVVQAVAFELTGSGYGGSIKLLLGLDTKGRILGVRVLAHAETPGLGDKVERQKSDWVLGFDGLSLGNTPVAMWKVKKDGGRFDQFSGATITPRSVVAVIRRGLELFQRRRPEFLDLKKPLVKENG